MSCNTFCGHWRHCLTFIFKTSCLLLCVAVFFLWQRQHIKDVNNPKSLGSLLVSSSEPPPPCPTLPPNLKGKLEVQEQGTIEEGDKRVAGVRKGGVWWPAHCRALWKVAVIVPYRNRYSQLGPFLIHMHAFLQRQELNYSIYIIEQKGNEPFNRGRLLNIGYLESQKEGPWDCFAFHDVDMLPENDHNLYHCTSQPRHLAVAHSNQNYKLIYDAFLGGACMLTSDQIQKVNGWSNRFWGWGAEDDDMWHRIDASKMGVFRYHADIARYKTLPHKPEPINENRMKILRDNRGKHLDDGLNTLHYIVKKINHKPLFTHILADIGSNSEAPP